jgi:hypothetical protein
MPQQKHPAQSESNKSGKDGHGYSVAAGRVEWYGVHLWVEKGGLGGSEWGILEGGGWRVTGGSFQCDILMNEAAVTRIHTFKVSVLEATGTDIVTGRSGVL